VEALSALSHPQVPRLYDHFSDVDHWYLVLEYIEGQTLESYLEARGVQGKLFQMEEILGIGLQLCTVLTYLHSRHPPLIFRDLKPDNIMRTPAGKLYLIDFGIARHYIVGQSRDTQSLGSPGYAAPEQYGRAQTDARTDLYGLGALLHQLLSGQDPSDTPRGLPPLHLNGQAGHAELESLVNRLLASDPQNRPASAHDVAREFERIRQRWSSVHDSQRIWQPPVPQNYPTGGGPQIQLQQQFRNMQQAMQPKRKRLTRRRVLVGISTAMVLGSFGAYTMSRASGSASSSATNPTLVLYRGHTDTVNALAWSPDSQSIASASADQTVQIWSAQTGNKAYTRNENTPVHAVSWSPDGSYLISGGTGEYVFWRASDAADAGNHVYFSSTVDALAWAPNTGGDQSALYVAVGLREDGIVLIQDGVRTDSTSLKYQTDGITSLAYSPDGWYLASGSLDQSVVIWDVSNSNRAVYTVYHGHTASVTSLTWLADGVYLASGSTDQTVRVWEAASGGTLLVYNGHTAAVNAVASSPDGQYIASASDDGTVRVWSAFDGSTLMTYTGHTAPVMSVAWSPDGRFIASGSADKTAQVWEAPSPLS
jgi:serine/threonine protein kinase